VAAVLNLTGPASRFDAAKKKSLTIALERIKALYPRVTLDLRVFDAGGGPEATTAAVSKALAEGCEYLLSGTSPTALAIAAQVRGRVPLVAQMANAATPQFGPPRKGEYRFWPDFQQETEVVFTMLRDHNLKKILLLHSADPYSEALTAELKRRTEAAGGFEVRELQYDPASTPDFRPAILRAREASSDAIAVFGLPPGIKALIGQMAQVHWDKAMVGGVNIDLALADYLAAGLKGDLWMVETEAMQESLPHDSEAQIFRGLFERTYGERPAFHSLYLADALYFIAASRSIEESPSVVDRLRMVKSFVGPSGQITINEDGTLRFAMSARRVAGEKR